MKIPTIFAVANVLCAAKEEDGALLQKRHVEEHRGAIIEGVCSNIADPDCTNCNVHIETGGYFQRCVFSPSAASCVNEGDMSVSDDENFCPNYKNEICNIPGCAKCHEYEEGGSTDGICTHCNVGYYWSDGNCIQRTKAEIDGQAVSCKTIGNQIEASCESCQKYYQNEAGDIAGMECTFVPSPHADMDPALATMMKAMGYYVEATCETVSQAAQEGHYTDQYCGVGLYDDGWQSAHPPCAVNVLLSYKEALCRWPEAGGYKYWNQRCQDDVDTWNETGTLSWTDVKKIMSRKHRNSDEYKEALAAEMVTDNKADVCPDKTYGCVDMVTTCKSAHANVLLLGEELWESENN